jgi:hypothetical protein
MPRQLRIRYEGAIHHFMNRGDRREWIGARLRMVSWSRVSNLLSAAMKVECKK